MNESNAGIQWVDGDSIAGHEGTLTSSDQSIFAKRVLPQELAFYSDALARQSPLLQCMPTWIGTLNHETHVLIVLENVLHGYRRPCVMDVKLGRVLYDEDTPPEKRARMDKVTAETTSGSLGWRIVGLQMAGKPKTERAYGRSLSAATVVPAVQQFFSLAPVEQAIIEEVARQSVEIMRTVESIHLRMVSASLLIVYESDNELKDIKLEAPAPADDITSQGTDGSEDSEDEDEGNKVATVKLIDFAHAKFTPGLGPDENVLVGLRHFTSVLQSLCT